MKHRILVVDDTEEIHELFDFILEDMNKCVNPMKVENQLDEILAGNVDCETESKVIEKELIIEHAFQGEEALEKIEKAYNDNSPYSLVFMDVRMPPGIDGIETIKRAREKYKDQEFIICTAFNNYDWNELFKTFGRNDKVLYITKPFCDTSLKQMTNYILAKVERA